MSVFPEKARMSDDRREEFRSQEKHEIKSRKEKPAPLMLIAVMRQRMDSPETVFTTVTKWLKRQIGKSGVIKLKVESEELKVRKLRAKK